MKLCKKTFMALVLGCLLSNSAWAVVVTRGPYLQMPTANSMVIKWRTDSASNSRVSIGTSSSNLNINFDDGNVVGDHEVKLTGLQPATKYYYSVGTINNRLASGADYYFITSPNPGAQQSTRIWILGDSGTANQDAASVRDAFVKYSGDRLPDVWLMLGDNAYNDGKDSEYQRAVFDMYPKQLRTLPLWSTLGNHETYGGSPYAYWSIFTFPTMGEVGGAPSGTESYYSFDYGDIHFICLDSMDSQRTTGDPNNLAPMVAWLEKDLMQNDKTWTMAFFHHPPYSKGTHDSDGASEKELREMREAVLPIMEEYGVDLVLSGHSHNYERSYLLDGHYGGSNTFKLSTMALDAGNGREDGDGVYQKVPDAGRSGAVYSVVGSSGKIGSPTGDKHPAMFVYLKELGSLVVDIAGDRLDGFFISNAGTVRDNFTIRKVDTLLPTGSVWRYWDQGMVPANNWAQPLYNDVSWPSGRARLGYGDGLEKTELKFGGNASKKFITSYFRNQFTVKDRSKIKRLRARLLRDDGAVVYLNGKEVYRANLPSGAITANTLAVSAVTGVNESQFETFSVPSDVLVDGVNTVAVEVHQNAADSSDVAFDLGFHPGDDQLQKNYPKMYVRGTFNAWGALAMSLIDDHVWSARVTFVSKSDAFKFEVGGGAAWQTNFGDANKDGVAESGGSNNNIVAPDVGDYQVVFNDQTLQYSMTVFKPTQQAPIAHAGVDLTVVAGTVVQFDGSASSDKDGSIVAYAWSNGLSGVKPSLTYDKVGEYDVTLTVTDNDGLTATDVVHVSVLPKNNQLPSVMAGNDQTITALSVVTLNGVASDSDGQIVSYAWAQLTGPSVSLATPNAAQASFAAPSVAVQTSLTFRLTVKDDQGAEASDDVMVTVLPAPKPNHAPVANAGPDKEVFSGAQVTLMGSATDADDDVTSYQWQVIGSNLVVLTQAQQASVSFAAPDVTEAQTVRFKLTAVDAQGNAASDMVSVTIQPRPSTGGSGNEGGGGSSSGSDDTTSEEKPKESGGSLAWLELMFGLAWLTFGRLARRR